MNHFAIPLGGIKFLRRLSPEQVIMLKIRPLGGELTPHEMAPANSSLVLHKVVIGFGVLFECDGRKGLGIEV
jgi:hypothetical protein